MGNIDKVKIQIDKNLADELLKLKGYGETYSDVIKRLLEHERR